MGFVVQVVMPLRVHVAVNALASRVCVCVQRVRIHGVRVRLLVPAPVCVSSNRAPGARVCAVVFLCRLSNRAHV